MHSIYLLLGVICIILMQKDWYSLKALWIYIVVVFSVIKKNTIIM